MWLTTSNRRLRRRKPVFLRRLVAESMRARSAHRFLSETGTLGPAVLDGLAMRGREK